MLLTQPPYHSHHTMPCSLQSYRRLHQPALVSCRGARCVPSSRISGSASESQQQVRREGGACARLCLPGYSLYGELCRAEDVTVTFPSGSVTGVWAGGSVRVALDVGGSACPPDVVVPLLLTGGSVRVAKVTEANLDVATAGGDVELGTIRAIDATVVTHGGGMKVTLRGG